MKKKNVFLLLLTALIWGTAFVAQSEGGDAVGSFSYNCIRSLIGGTVLLPVIAFFDKLDSSRKPQSKEDRKILLIGGICCGVILCVATNLQQLGIDSGTPAGKAGFLTACYIVLVPIIGIFIGRKCKAIVWVAVALALPGLYLLCMDGESFELQKCDTFVILCAVMFAMHILVIDYFSPKVDGIRLSCIQFYTCGIITSIPMIATQVKPLSGGLIPWLATLSTWDAWGPLLFGGVMSCGVAYTLQIIAQNGLAPSVASIIMSLESVFSVIAGWIILGEKMSARALLGCGLIFTAVILCNISSSDGEENRKNEVIEQK